MYFSLFNFFTETAFTKTLSQLAECKEFCISFPLHCIYSPTTDEDNALFKGLEKK
jgi:hypothetical protein